MTTKDQSLVPGLDALASWRQSLARELSSLTHYFSSNDLLSARRAERVRDLLVERGLPAEAVQARGVAARDFQGDPGAENDLRRNRRVDLRVRIGSGPAATPPAGRSASPSAGSEAPATPAPGRSASPSADDRDDAKRSP